MYLCMYVYMLCWFLSSSPLILFVSYKIAHIHFENNRVWQKLNTKRLGSNVKLTDWEVTRCLKQGSSGLCLNQVWKTIIETVGHAHHRNVITLIYNAKDVMPSLYRNTLGLMTRSLLTYQIPKNLITCVSGSIGMRQTCHYTYK